MTSSSSGAALRAVPAQRDRDIYRPSIHYPLSLEEACEAVVAQERRRLRNVDPTAQEISVPFTVHVSPGMPKRTPAQVDFLNQARLAMIEHLRKALED